jgi:hypothetical protein
MLVHGRVADVCDDVIWLGFEHGARARLDLDLRPCRESVSSHAFVNLKKHVDSFHRVYPAIKGVRTTYPFVTRRYPGDLLCRNFCGNRLATFFFGGEKVSHRF